MKQEIQNQDLKHQIHKLGCKLYLIPSESLDFGNFIKVFSQWIQKQLIQDHLLIDVHDYRHVYNGPGILLVGHEGNFSLDFEMGRPGLSYYRKQRIEDHVEVCLRTSLLTLVKACQLLQQTKQFSNNLRFSTNEILVFSNDRLNAPNQKNTRLLFEKISARLFDGLSPERKSYSYPKTDSRDRFKVTLNLPELDLDSLFQRLKVSC